MSDFQDEQGLGELPADLYAQYVEQFKPNSSPISGVAASAPPNLSSDSPKYPVSVDSVFQTLPVNAVDFLTSGGEFISSDSATAFGVPGVATLVHDVDSSNVDVLKKLSWNVSPRRYFSGYSNSAFNALGALTIIVGGIVVHGVNNLPIADSGEIDLNVIAGQSVKVQVILDFRNSYGQIASTNYGGNYLFASLMKIDLSGFSLLSRGLPPNFEIAS